MEKGREGTSSRGTARTDSGTAHTEPIIRTCRPSLSTKAIADPSDEAKEEEAQERWREKAQRRRHRCCLFVFRVARARAARSCRRLSSSSWGAFLSPLLRQLLPQKIDKEVVGVLM
ncbi:unnamed protein product [Sphagnum troendelagicum]|uniref:Uncharacterized protein n=1 Tax=Sphagnum troendelagicum TaxID=128251 RepID=A0ABP0UHV7_9BRYO